jgi:hypothetical protein
MRFRLRPSRTVCVHVIWALGLCATLATTSPSATDQRMGASGRELTGNSSVHMDVIISRSVIEQADRLSIEVRFVSTTGVDATVRAKPDSTLPAFAEETRDALRRAQEYEPDGSMLRATESGYTLAWKRMGCMGDAGAGACFDFESLEALCPGDKSCRLGFTLERMEHGDVWPEPSTVGLNVKAERDTYQTGCIGKAEDQRAPMPDDAKVEVEITGE